MGRFDRRSVRTCFLESQDAKHEPNEHQERRYRTMSSLADILSQRFEILTQPHPGKKPTKPQSGYNMFYQAQARRVRKREAALRLFEKRAVSSSDPMEIAAAIGENFAELDQSPTKKSGGCHATKFIGGKWKSLSTEAKSRVAAQG